MTQSMYDAYCETERYRPRNSDPFGRLIVIRSKATFAEANILTINVADQSPKTEKFEFSNVKHWVII